uniref:Integrase catalytic domain-containing protein n=1 Tax=Myripristis murdjan TaxID=586833 RepID=A0A667XMX4_9TELE
MEAGVLQREVKDRHTGNLLRQIVLPATWTHTVWKQKGRPEVRAPLLPIESSYPLETVAMDYLSLGRAGDHYQYILVMTDLFSRYSWAVPTRDQTAVTTAKALWHNLIQTWGCPERILSDRGAAFESAVMAELCQLYGCSKIRTTSYHPQGNGACERFNQTLLSLLRSLDETDQQQWPAKLPALLQAYNNTEHSCTGLTPHFVLHGRHARLPVEMATGAPHNRTRHSLEGWVQSHHQTLLRAYQHVAAQTRQRQQQDKARYDSKVKHVPLLPGERVLLRNFRRHNQGKLAPRWQSTPYVIVCQMRPHQPVYKIRPEGKEGPERTIHRNNIRPCPFEPLPPHQPVAAQTSREPDATERLSDAPLCLVPVAPALAPAVRQQATSPL